MKELTVARSAFTRQNVARLQKEAQKAREEKKARQEAAVKKVND